MNRTKLISTFEVTGSGLAILYALAIASNTGNEVLAFWLLLISACLFAAWGLVGSPLGVPVAAGLLYRFRHPGADPLGVRLATRRRA